MATPITDSMAALLAEKLDANTQVVESLDGNLAEVKMVQMRMIKAAEVPVAPAPPRPRPRRTLRVAAAVAAIVVAAGIGNLIVARSAAAYNESARQMRQIADQLAQQKAADEGRQAYASQMQAHCNANNIAVWMAGAKADPRCNPEAPPVTNPSKDAVIP